MNPPFPHFFREGAAGERAGSSKGSPSALVDGSYSQLPAAQSYGRVPSAFPGVNAGPGVALLTGGSDKPYVIGIVRQLVSMGISLDLLGSDELDCPEFHGTREVRFLNLRGSQDQRVSVLDKVLRISKYYIRLFRYAASAKPKIFHILWNNKFEYFDRTVLMLYYRALGKKIVFTAHNVNAARRDQNDSWLNRFTLWVQYHLCDQIFVHTDKSRVELHEQFAVPESRITVIPFGINNAVPHTVLTSEAAKHLLSLSSLEKVILFFGRITPYKGVEYVINAVRQLWAHDPTYRLIIAGRPDNCESYWNKIEADIEQDIAAGRIMLRATFIPDNEVEIYFKAADVLALPYKEIYQSGVLFLAHSFGLPVIAADVGSLKDDIVEGQTGSIFQPEDANDLIRALREYFSSDLYKNLDERRPGIKDYATERHSWDIVGGKMLAIYSELLGVSCASDRSQETKTSAVRSGSKA